MALVLNTNIAALNASRNLATTQNQQATTFQRLSTGLRVNSAKDDAAGLYLAQSQTKDIRGLNMATRNASDGISMAQTAEGAMDQIGSNLQRINELAIQSANGTYDNIARAGLQKEVDELTQEIARIISVTEFNGKKLLDYEAEKTTFQIGFKNEADSQIDLDFKGGIIGSIAGGSFDDAVVPPYDPEDPPLKSNADTVYQALSKLHPVTTTTLGDLQAALDDVDTSSSDIAAATIANIFGSSLTGLRTIDISTQETAQFAITTTRATIDNIAAERATFGAKMNRFEAVISGNNIYSENLSAARSRIQDADFAVETSNLAKQQVLQQAGVASLSQANQASQVILGLL